MARPATRTTATIRARPPAPTSRTGTTPAGSASGAGAARSARAPPRTAGRRRRHSRPRAGRLAGDLADELAEEPVPVGDHVVRRGQREEVLPLATEVVGGVERVAEVDGGFGHRRRHAVLQVDRLPTLGDG